MAQQLPTIMLIQVVRLHLAEATNGSVGWLFALTDKRIRAAIAAMHKAPAQRWTVKLLAECAVISRTSSAVRFKATVGLSPMDYLTH
jgi:transcriptional regulator GlxA family with amidase domain